MLKYFVNIEYFVDFTLLSYLFLLMNKCWYIIHFHYINVSKFNGSMMFNDAMLLNVHAHAYVHVYIFLSI